MTVPPSPLLLGIQLPGGGFRLLLRSATRDPTHQEVRRAAKASHRPTVFALDAFMSARLCSPCRGGNHEGSTALTVHEGFR